MVTPMHRSVKTRRVPSSRPAGGLVACAANPRAGLRLREAWEREESLGDGRANDNPVARRFPGLQECRERGLSGPKAQRVDTVAVDLVADDPLGGTEQARRARPVPACAS